MIVTKGGMSAVRVGLALGASMLAGSAANAQGAAPQEFAGEQTENAAFAEDIVVTARLRDERLLDIPAAVTALNSEALARYSTSDFTSLSKQVPQLMISRAASGNGAAVTLRGIGSNVTSDDGIEQAVSFNIDGVPTSRGRVIQQGLFDLKSVQVLKGPQALFFGKNSPGGVVAVASRDPGDHLEGYLQAGYEFKAREYVVEGAIGGPIAPDLGVRLAMRGSSMEKGYVRNVAGPISAANNPLAFDRANGIALPGASFDWGPGAKQIAARFTMVYEPSTDFDATLKVFASHYRDNGDSAQNVILSCPAGDTQTRTLDRSPGVAPGTFVVDPFSTCRRGARTTSIGALPASLAAGYLGGNADGEQFTKNNNLLTSLVMNYRTGDVTLTSVTSAYIFKNDSVTYSDTTLFALASGAGVSRYKSYAQEFRIVSDLEGPLDFTAGAFIARENRTYDATSDIIRNLTVINGMPFSTDAANHQTNEGTTVSGFAELRYALSPELEIAGGARATFESKNSQLNVIFRQPNLPITLPPNQPIIADLDEGNVSPQATVVWHPTPNSTLFAGYRTGFKAGTIVNPALIPANATAQSVVLKNETIRGFEGGFKFQTDDRRLTGDLTLYSYDYKNLQSAAFNAQLVTIVTRNAGAASVKGAEANVTYRPTDEISLRSSASYNKAKFTDFANAQCFSGQNVVTGCVNAQQDLSGRPLPRAPKWMVSGGVAFDHPLAAGLRIGATLDAQYSSSYFLSAVVSPFAFQKGYATVDASVRLRDEDSAWELALIGRNLTNAFYAVVATDRTFAPQPGSTQGIPGTPRTVLLQAKYNFQ